MCSHPRCCTITSVSPKHVLSTSRNSISCTPAQNRWYIKVFPYVFPVRCPAMSHVACTAIPQKHVPWGKFYLCFPYQYHSIAARSHLYFSIGTSKRAGNCSHLKV